MSTLIKRKSSYIISREIKTLGQEKILIKRKRALHMTKGSVFQEDITIFNMLFTHGKHIVSNCVW